MWTSVGGHDIPEGVSIEGVGSHHNAYVQQGTWIHYIGGSGFMFRILANRHHCSLKNMMINMGSDHTTEVGLLVTDLDSSQSNPYIYQTLVQNVGFFNGAYGIKWDSSAVQFDSTQNRLEKVTFVGCSTGFYCNSINTAFLFDSCYWNLPAAGIAVHCPTVGHLAFENCNFAGNPPLHMPPSDGSTILKTHGAFNAISFHSCQDEGIEFMYQNTNPFLYFPVVFKDCLIQSKLKFTASGTVIIDSCQVYSPSKANQADPAPAAVEDSSSAEVRVFLKGLNNFFTYTDLHTSSVRYWLGGKIAYFQNNASRVIYEATEIDLPIFDDKKATAEFWMDATRGRLLLDSGYSQVTVHNKYVTADNCFVLANIGSVVPRDLLIGAVVCHNGYFVIYLTTDTSSETLIGFKVLGQLNQYFDTQPVICAGGGCR